MPKREVARGIFYEFVIFNTETQRRRGILKSETVWPVMLTMSTNCVGAIPFFADGKEIRQEFFRFFHDAISFI